MTVMGTTRRWIVPAGVLTVILTIGAVASVVPAHADPPNLPTLTPAELLAKVRTAQVPSLSGTITIDSNLGLPDTGALASSIGGATGTNLGDLVSGIHSVEVWIDGPDRQRLATSKPLAETNWIRNGSDLWSYDSSSLIAKHATIPGVDAAAKNAVAPLASNQTPAAFAQQLLDQVTPSTSVRVDTPDYVDSRPVYELVLSPKDAASTVQDAVISVDAATGVPLAVRLDAKLGGNPAFSLGFTAVNFNKPDPSRFNFTPPPGSTVVQAASPTELTNPSVGALPQRIDRPSGSMPLEARRVKGIGPVKRFLRPGRVGQVAPDVPQGPPQNLPLFGAAAQSDQVRTVGKDWSTVVIADAGALPPEVINLFAQAPTIAVGTQQGRVVTTPLVNAILIPGGRLVAGALTPAALAAAAVSAG